MLLYVVSLIVILLSEPDWAGILYSNIVAYPQFEFKAPLIFILSEVNVIPPEALGIYIVPLKYES